jgi:hypothetical protein
MTQLKRKMDSLQKIVFYDSKETGQVHILDRTCVGISIRYGDNHARAGSCVGDIDYRLPRENKCIKETYHSE